MQAEKIEGVRLALRFADRSLMKPVLEALSRTGETTVRFLRGHLSSSDASFEIELSGEVERIEEIVSLGRRWGAIMIPPGRSPENP